MGSDSALLWSYHHLTVSGPASAVATFAAAARGPGVIPWRLDLDAVEEGVFALAVSQSPVQRSLTVEGCRVLTRQFRDRVAAHHAKATALVAGGRSRACPLDLHALLQRWCTDRLDIFQRLKLCQRCVSGLKSALIVP